MKQRQRQTGFTLIELMVVMVLLGVLAGSVVLGVGAYERRQVRAFIDDALAVLNMMRLYSAERGMPVGIWQTQDGLLVQVLSDVGESNHTKNRMELSVDIDKQSPVVHWQPLTITMPQMPTGLRLEMDTNKANQAQDSQQACAIRQKQGVRPWLQAGQDAPLMLWYDWHHAQTTRVALYQGDERLGVFVVAADGRVVFE